MKQRVIWGIILSSVCLLIIYLAFYFYHSYKINDNYIKINVSDYMNDYFLYNVSVDYFGNKQDLYCSIDNENWVNITMCNFNLDEGNYVLYLKNQYFYTTMSFRVNKKIMGSFKSSLDNLETYYLALGGKKEINFLFDYDIDIAKSIKWSVDRDDIVAISDNTLYGKNVGEVNITATLCDGNSVTYHVLVTDLIKPAKIDNNKSYLPCKNYTNEENELLDKILESRVIEAGVGTRGGVVAAARFLTLEFPYSIRYFNENGRLVDHGYRLHIDGEGRYYHKGLYLSESKYAGLEKGASTKTGPKMWGCNIYDYFVERYNMNGFTCSGFVTWAMLNGGFVVGDVGAGNYKEFDDDLSDLGPHNKITYDYMESGNYQVGDFIARNGHAALIIGIDDNYIYTAESLPPKLKVYKYERYRGIVENDNLTYIIEMSNIYPNGDGLYDSMW